MTDDQLTPVLEFLRCRSPQAWIEWAVTDLDALLLDHASLELKAAQQAQKLIRRYGSVPVRQRDPLPSGFRSKLVYRMSRLAREELRHFELVVARIEARGGRLTAQSSSRYAASLHQAARSGEPAALVDALIIGAIIEARSCERFFSLVEPLRQLDADLADFYSSLLRSEARHFEDYLLLARSAAGVDCEARIGLLLDLDAALIEQPDTELRFHSGPPTAGSSARRAV